MAKMVVSPLVTEEIEQVKIVDQGGTLYIRVNKGLKEEHNLQKGDVLSYARHIATGRLVLMVAPAAPKKEGE